MATNNSINSNIPIEISKGGTNATSMATTRGTVYYDGTRLVTTATGSSGQVLTSNGSGSAPTYQSTSASRLVLISSQAASASASIIFTSISSYTNYLLVMNNVQPATNTAVLNMAVSQDNGATYLNTGYTSGILYNAYNSTTLTNSNSTTIFVLSGPQSSAGFFSCALSLHNVNLGDPCEISGIANWSDTTLATSAVGTIGGQSNTGINAIKVLFSSGNITSGTFSLYGVNES